MRTTEAASTVHTCQLYNMATPSLSDGMRCDSQNPTSQNSSNRHTIEPKATHSQPLYLQIENGVSSERQESISLVKKLIKVRIDVERKEKSRQGCCICHCRKCTRPILYYNPSHEHRRHGTKTRHQRLCGRIAIAPVSRQ